MTCDSKCLCCGLTFSAGVWQYHMRGGRVDSFPTQSPALQASIVANNIEQCMSRKEVNKDDNPSNDSSMNVEYYPLRRHAQGPLASMHVSSSSCRMVKRCSKVDFVDKHSMAYMVVHAYRL